MPAPLPIPTHTVPHSKLEDLQGLGIGIFATTVALSFLTHLGLLTGQTAGLALIISYMTGYSFSWVFFLINIPFYACAWSRLGPEFTIKSVICVTTVSVLMAYVPGLMPFGDLNPIFGTIAFGIICGLGVLGVFRHKGSLGGLGVVALIIQDKTGFRAGLVQLIADGVLFSVAFLLFPAETVLYSLLGAAVLNGVIAFNHRRDRYISD